nr:hypothetical protein [Tanacetum cinerariifolium]GEX81258.1 hypothetical protein [Tanacetum cinerariifolium]GEX82508.1 hypothetical protein [Tanacetum cinerariifolium]
MYNAFRIQSSLASLSSVTSTFSITDTPTNIKGENATHATTKEPLSHTKGETDANFQENPKEPKQSTDADIGFIGSFTHPPITKAQPITIIYHEPSVSQREGKGIATNDQEEDQRKLDAKHEVLKRQYTENVRKSLELRKHKYDSYMWPISIRLIPEPTTNINIHPKTKPVLITVYRGIDGRIFDVHKPFLSRAFSISESDELREIIPKKKNTVVKDLMNSLSRRYERFRKISKEHVIQSALLAPEQAPSQTSGRKQKHMKLEPKKRIPGLKCNRTLFENIPFINNMVIEEPEYGIFFTDEFGDKAFQRWSDIDKVGMEAFVSYLLAKSMVKSLENARFSMKLRKLIAEHPD